jgi:hypothetical protein
MKTSLQGFGLAPRMEDSTNLSRESGRFIHYIHDPDNPNSLNHNTINSIAEDQLGISG